MSGAFQYRPKFRDIRVKPPGKEEARTGEQTCEWAGCVRKGECRAPKSPEDLKHFYWFCAEHAAKYNRSWDFSHSDWHKLDSLSRKRAEIIC